MINMFLYGELVETNNLKLVLGNIPIEHPEVAELKGYEIVAAEVDISGIISRPLKSVKGLLWKMNEEQVERLQDYLGAAFKLRMCEVLVDKIPRAATMLLYTGRPKIYPVSVDKVNSKLLSFAGLYADDPLQRKVIEQTLNTMFPDYNVQWLARTYPYFVLWLREVGMKKDNLLNGYLREHTERDVFECLACLFRVSPSMIESIHRESFIPIPMSLDKAQMIKRATDVFLSHPHTSIVNDFETITETYDHHDELCAMTPNVEDNPVDIFFEFVEYTSVMNDFDGQLLLLLIMDVLHMPLIPLTEMGDKVLSAWILNKIKERRNNIGRDTSTG